MGKKLAAAMTAGELREQIRQFVEELRCKVYGDKGLPDWGALLDEIIEQTASLLLELSHCAAPSASQTRGPRPKYILRDKENSSVVHKSRGLAAWCTLPVGTVRT